MGRLTKKMQMMVMSGSNNQYYQRILRLFGSSIVGYWPLSEPSGTAANDIGINDLDGVYSNVTLAQSGIGDGKTAASFNGTTSRVNIYSAGLVSKFNAAEGTFSIWMKVTDAGVWTDTAYHRLLNLAVDANNRIYITKHSSDNVIEFVYVAGGVTKSITRYNNTSTDWMNVVISWSKSLDIVRFYINGSTDLTIQGSQLDALGTWVGNLVNTTSLIGANNTNQLVWSGYLAHAVLLDRLINPIEAKKIASVQSTPESFPYAYPAAAPLTTPTYDGSGFAVHPDIYDAGIGNSWNGHRYWMVVTPFDGSNVRLENPSILVSEDGTTWSVPDGLTNPIEPDPGAPNNNADPEMIVGEDNVMYVYFTQLGKIWVKSSSDGITWSAKADTGIAARYSPTVVYDGTKYVMWAMDFSSSPNNLCRRECATPDGVWSGETICTLANLQTGRDLWHININKNGPVYDGLFSTCELDVSGGNGLLYFAKSYDGGLTWTFGDDVLLGVGLYDGNAPWDTTIYRAAMVPAMGGYDLWYSAYGNLAGVSNWRVGRTFIYAP